VREGATGGGGVVVTGSQFNVRGGFGVQRGSGRAGVGGGFCNNVER